MKSTTAALLISASREFLGYYARLLKSEDFEIIKARGYHDWSEKRHLFQFDVCLIDNEDGEFDFETFFFFFSRYNPHAVVLNFGHEPPAPPSGHNYLYCGAGRQISAASFIRNLSEGFRRARARTELAAMLIHDIRSPLHSMLAYIELLLNHNAGPLSDSQKNYLEKTMLLGDQTLKMLEDINEVYKSEQHVFSVDKAPFPISRSVDQALLNVWAKADQKHITIRKEIQDGLPDILGDVFQVQRVFMNLIGNAVKYCRDNSLVIIRARQKSDRMAEVLVTDNGGGIPEEDLEKIFKKSFRVKQHEQQHSGYGLGLYICKLIVKAHGGVISAENNPQGGVSFIFTLPLNNGK